MKKHIGMIIPTLLISAILIGATGCSKTTTDKTTATTVNTTLTTTTALVTTTTTGNAYINSASSEFVNGLALSLALDGYTYKPGQAIQIAINEQNRLNRENTIPAANSWAYNQLNLGACGINGSMYAFAVFRGSYTILDIANLTPLPFYDYTLLPPCAMIPYPDSYTFKASSDTVTTQYGEYQALLTSNITGYWTGTPKAVKNSFEPGVYTVLAGDEWGNLVVVHFTVAN